MMKFEVRNSNTHQFYGDIEIDERFPNVPMVHFSQPLHKGFYLGKLVITKEFSEDYVSLVELNRMDDYLEKMVYYLDDEKGVRLIPLIIKKVK